MVNLIEWEDGQILFSEPLNENFKKTSKRTDVNSKVVSQMINSIEEIGLATSTVSVNYDGVIYKKAGLSPAVSEIGGDYDLSTILPDYLQIKSVKIESGSSENQLLVLYEKTNNDHSIGVLNLLTTIPTYTNLFDIAPINMPDKLSAEPNQTERSFMVTKTESGNYVIILWYDARNTFPRIFLYASMKSYDATGTVIHSNHAELNNQNTLEDRITNGYISRITFNNSYAYSYDGDKIVCHYITQRQDFEGSPFFRDRDAACFGKIIYNETDGTMSNDFTVYRNYELDGGIWRWWNYVYEGTLYISTLVTFFQDSSNDRGYMHYHKADLSNGESPQQLNLTSQNNEVNSTNHNLTFMNGVGHRMTFVDGSGTTAFRGTRIRLFVADTLLDTIDYTWTGGGRVLNENLNYFPDGVEIEFEQNNREVSIDKNIRFDGETQDRIFFSAIGTTKPTHFVYDNNDGIISLQYEGGTSLVVMQNVNTTIDYTDTINFTTQPEEIVGFSEFIVNDFWYLFKRDTSVVFEMKDSINDKQITMGEWDKIDFNPNEVTITLNIKSPTIASPSFGYYTILHYNG